MQVRRGRLMVGGRFVMNRGLMMLGCLMMDRRLLMSHRLMMDRRLLVGRLRDCGVLRVLMLYLSRRRRDRAGFGMCGLRG